mgnify:CR=1 FL=1
MNQFRLPKQKLYLYYDAFVLINKLLTIIYCLGAFGNVKLCWLKKKPDTKFAIKAMKKKEIIDSKHVDHIENEMKILEAV